MHPATVQWLEAFLHPSPLALTIAIILVLTIPIFLHTLVFKTSGLTTLPSILLIGPSGSGKTALLTLFERGTPATTHTTQAPISIECSLPLGTHTTSDKYRSAHDPTSLTHKKFLLIDTPGHGKLRHHALSSVTTPQNLQGIIFLVDANTLATGSESLRHAADYLHDILLLLQKRAAQSTKAVAELRVLVAANKMDLFTALPVRNVVAALEREISSVRVSRSKGLLDSGIGLGEEEQEENDEWLGEMGSAEFKFSQMAEFGVEVEVVGGNVIGDEGADVGAWWSWVGERL